jgi:hypothetical protein
LESPVPKTNNQVHNQQVIRRRKRKIRPGKGVKTASSIHPVVKFLSTFFGTTTTPVVQIISPTAGSAVTADGYITVEFETDLPGVPHTLVLLDATNPLAGLQNLTFTPASATGTVSFHIPADPGGVPQDYLLQLAIAPGFTDGQFLHQILITTKTFKITGVSAPGPYSSGAPITFTATTTDTSSTATFSWGFGDGSSPQNTGTTPQATHTYAAGLYTLTVTATLGTQTATATFGPFGVR